MEFMKANRKFKNKDDAVSAVIGVILMVAITVAIAATVYVYVSGMIGESPQTTPNMQLVRDNTNNKLTVASADPGNLKWGSFAVTVTGAQNYTLSSENLFDSTTDGWTDHYINSSGDGSDDLVEAGQAFELKGVDADGATIIIRHRSSNTLIGTWEFN